MNFKVGDIVRFKDEQEEMSVELEEFYEDAKYKRFQVAEAWRNRIKIGNDYGFFLYANRFEKIDLGDKKPKMKREDFKEIKEEHFEVVEKIINQGNCKVGDIRSESFCFKCPFSYRNRKDNRMCRVGVEDGKDEKLINLAKEFLKFREAPRYLVEEEFPEVEISTEAKTHQSQIKDYRRTIELKDERIKELELILTNIKKAGKW